MPIRLNKVTQNLNVGLSTIVEFLQKKGFPGEKNSNTKISDEEYELLIKEFSTDKTIKLESEKMSLERHQKDKKETVAAEGYDAPQKGEEVKTEIPEDLRPRFVTVGHIDLDTIGKKINKGENPVIPSENEIVPEKPQPEKEPKVEKTTMISKATEEIVPENTEREDDEKTKEPEEENIIPVKKPDVNEEPSVSSEPEIFRLNQPPTVTIKKTGTTINLDNIPTNSRPPKETDEQKKKRREEEKKKRNEQKEKERIRSEQAKKEPAQIKNPTPGEANVEKKEKPVLVKKGEVDELKKKKRERIKREKIDIEKGAPTYNKHDDTRSKFRKPVTKNEVSEEDVQKQIKETLARLTNKGQKKGAKYRKEKREAVSQRQSEQHEIETQESKTIKITEFVTANDLASMMNVPVVRIISTCMSIGIMVSINQRLDAETINIIADEFGYKTEYVSAEVTEAISEEETSRKT